MPRPRSSVSIIITVLAILAGIYRFSRVVPSITQSRAPTATLSQEDAYLVTIQPVLTKIREQFDQIDNQKGAPTSDQLSQWATTFSQAHTTLSKLTPPPTYTEFHQRFTSSMLYYSDSFDTLARNPNDPVKAETAKQLFTQAQDHFNKARAAFPTATPKP